MIKLTYPQQSRLRELAQPPRGYIRNAGIAKVSTEKLAALGLVRIEGRVIAKTGRLVSAGEAFVTAAGREWLANFT